MTIQVWTIIIFSVLTCIIDAFTSISTTTNTTSFPFTNQSTTDDLYTPTTLPTTSPTWSPTVDGEFPYIHYVQSLIACGFTIILEDTFGSPSFAEFTTLDSIDDDAVITFVVCKSTSMFHSYDALQVWFGDIDNGTEWEVVNIPSDPSIYCSAFQINSISSNPSSTSSSNSISVNLSIPQSYYLGLDRYEDAEHPDDYGQYTIYMQCDHDDVDKDYDDEEEGNSINDIIDGFDSFNASNGEYFLYTQPPFTESESTIDVVSDISCGITLTDYVSTTDFFGSADRMLYYRFTVVLWTKWVDLWTCDNTKKSHSITLYYSHGGDDWSTITRSVSPESCSQSTFPRFYDLIPGHYYIGISIHNLQYNHYTLAMNCSSEGDEGSIVTVTDYTPYIPSSPSPTGYPTPKPTASDDLNSNDDNASNAVSYGMGVAIIVVLIALVVGIYFGRKRYRNRKEIQNRRKRKMKQKQREKARSKSGDEDSRKKKMSPKAEDRNHGKYEAEKEESKSYSSTTVNEVEVDGYGGNENEEEEEDDDGNDPYSKAGGRHVAHLSEGGEGIAVAADAAAMDIAAVADSNISGSAESDVAAPAAFAAVDFAASSVPVTVPMTVLTVNDPFANDAAPNANDNVEEGVEAIEEEDTDVESENEEFELPMEQFEFQKGSLVTIGRSGGTFGIVLEVSEKDMLNIIDFFERRKCKKHQQTLGLIQDPEMLEKAKMQYEKFKRRQKRTRSRGQK